MRETKKICAYCKKTRGEEFLYPSSAKKCEKCGTILEWNITYSNVSNAVAPANIQVPVNAYGSVLPKVQANWANPGYYPISVGVIEEDDDSSTYIDDDNSVSMSQTEYSDKADDKAIPSYYTEPVSYTMHSGNAIKEAVTQQTNPASFKKPSLPVRSFQSNSIVAAEFNKRNIIGMDEACKLLENMYSKWETEELKVACGNPAKDDFTIKELNFAIVGEELTGRAELANVITAIINHAGIRENESPVEISLKDDFEPAMGNEKALDSFAENYKDQTVLVKEALDEAFQTGDGVVKADSNKVTDFINSLDHLKGKLTLIFKTTPKLFEGLKKNPKVADYICKVPIGTYKEKDLVDLTVKYFGEQGYTVSPAAKDMIQNKIRRTSFADYSQGRFVRDLYNSSIDNMTLRLNRTQIPLTDLTIEAEDIPFKTFDEKEALEALQIIKNRPGQQELKDYADKIYKTALSNAKRARVGEKEINVGYPHIVLEGEAGTGKSSSCPMIAKLLYSCGKIESPEPIMASVAELQSPYVGATPDKVATKFKDSRGKLLVIDEAYQLSNQGNFGQEVINAIVAKTGEPKCDVVVCLIGYPGTFKALKKLNEGLSSRFPNVIRMEELSLDELVTVFKGRSREKGIQIECGCDDLIEQLIDQERKTTDFGNARGVVTLFDRLVQSNNCSIIKRAILEKAIMVSRGTKGADALEELNSMIGIDSAKKTINDLSKRLKGKQKRRDAGNKTSETDSMNTLFIGPPGTGKTTVAKLFASILADLGLLKDRSNFVEKRGKDLIGSYIGHTEERVSKAIEEAKGGVLFIDEAYQLDNGTSFGTAGINALVGEIEKKGSDLIVFLAGYEDKMEAFLSKNEGLASRFPNVIKFDAYSVDDLWKIFVSIIEKKGCRLADNIAIEKKVRAWFEEESQRSDFGNGRSARNLVETCIGNLEIRIADDEDNRIPRSEYDLIQPVDIPVAV